MGQAATLQALVSPRLQFSDSEADRRAYSQPDAQPGNASVRAEAGFVTGATLVPVVYKQDLLEKFRKKNLESSL